VPRDDYLPFGTPAFSEQEIEAVVRVLRSGWVGMGPETIAFERELAAYVGAPHVVAVNSCTSALFLSLLVSGVRAGDEVICPSLTWCSTANAALYLGARPVFCDIDAETFCLTPRLVLAKIGPRTKAVTAVHFGGLATDIAALKDALPPGVAIIEDAAHAFGARYPNGQPVGSSGHLSCFSFYANKNLSTGDGGAIALFDAEVAARLRSLRQHALPIDAWQRFQHPTTILYSNELTELGYKMNYTDLQAAIGRVQLARQEGFAATRREIAQIYREGLDHMQPRLQLQKNCTDSAHARHLFLVRLPVESMKRSRDEVVLELRARNIGATIHYAPLHTMPLYCDGARPASLPVTEAVAGSIVTLPMSASMSAADARQVVEEVEAAVGGGSRSAARKDRQTYGFYDRLTAEFPSQVIVDVTEICNLACIHCPHPQFKVSEHYAGRYLDEGLNRKLVDEVRDFGAGKTQFIRYSSSGETLVHPKIYDMLQYAVDRSGVFVTLTTNGTLLNEKRIAKLFASGLHLIDISLDAVTPETYAAVRLHGDLEVTRANVLKLLGMKRRLGAPVSIAVSFVEQPQNAHEVQDFGRYWREQGADSIVIRRLHSAAGGAPQIAEQLRAEDDGGVRRPCLYPWERILLSPRGDLTFCPQDWIHGSIVADYSRTTIRAVWQSEFYRRLRQAHLTNDYSCHGFCGQCPDWKQTRWPGQGSSYADLVQDCLVTPSVVENDEHPHGMAAEAVEE